MSSPRLRSTAGPTYTATRIVTGTALRVWTRARIAGREHLPRTGPVLVVSNHLSLIDIPLIALGVPRHVCFVARASLADSRPLAWLMEQCGAILVERGTPDRAALRAMQEHLEAGDCVAVFPEGTRSKDGRVGQFRRGAFLAAKQLGCPVVPAGVRGTDRAWPSGATIPRPVGVGLAFGAPLDGADPGVAEAAREAVARLAGAELAPDRASDRAAAR